MVLSTCRCHFGRRFCDLNRIYCMAMEGCKSAAGANSHIRKPNCQRIMLDDVRQWMELLGSGVLYPYLLSAGFWIFDSCLGCNAASNHIDAE